MEHTRAGRDIDTTESTGTDGDAGDAQEPGSSLGLFCENNGTIKDIIFENAVVDNAVADNETAGDGDTVLPGDGNDGGEGTAGGTDGEAGIGEDDSEETGFEKFGTGTVCGINRGTLENISVKGGSVAGNENVGGIAGKDEASEDSSGTGEPAGGKRVYTPVSYTHLDVYKRQVLLTYGAVFCREGGGRIRHRAEKGHVRSY